LSPLYQTLLPFADALLRAAVGLALVPHGLRNTFGFFPNTGVRALNLTDLAKQLDETGYRPGKLWANFAHPTHRRAAPCTRPVHAPGRRSGSGFPSGQQCRTLARRPLFLESAWIGIYADVDDRHILRLDQRPGPHSLDRIFGF
jgi:hypothetical protein